jgi:uncharacterized protein YegL
VENRLKHAGELADRLTILLRAVKKPGPPPVQPVTVTSNPTNEVQIWLQEQQRRNEEERQRREEAELRKVADVGLATNFENRLPCVLLLDVSSSMKGERIEELNRGLQVYRTEVLADSLAAQRVEVAVITFGTEVTLECPFTTIDQFKPPILTASGKTALGAALNRAQDLLDQRKRQYRGHGLTYFRPWLFLITDGAPTDDWRPAAERLLQAQADHTLSFFAVGVEGAAMTVLQALSRRPPLKLKGLRFRDLFAWMSQSQRSLSQSSPGQEEQVRLVDPTAGNGWATV